MSQNIFLNDSHITDKNNNNQFRYTLPNAVDFKEGDQIGISSLSLNVSMFNIDDSIYQNNVFQYLFWDINGVHQLNTITIKPGIYSLASVYAYIIDEMYDRGQYLEYIELDSNGNVQILYPLFARVNESYYRISFLFSTIGQNMNFGSGDVAYTTIFKVPTTWTVPNNTESMGVVFPTYNGMDRFFGFEKGTVMPQIESSNFEFLVEIGTKAPQVTPVNSYIVNCDWVHNELSASFSTLTSFSIPTGLQVSDNFQAINTTPLYSFITPGKHKTLNITIQDQYFNNVKIEDNNINIGISIIREN